jgi:hypothetical protein
MFREDYVLRMIQQAVAVITAILGLTRLERYPEALVEVDRALQRFVGLNLSLVTALSASELVAMLRWGERLDVGKVVVLAELLQAEGDIYAAQGQTGEAQARHVKSLELLLEVAFETMQSRGGSLPSTPSGETRNYAAAVQPRIAELKSRLDPAALPADLAEWLAHYETVVAALPAASTAE